MKEASSDPDIASRRSDAQLVAYGISDRPDTELRDLPPLNEHAAATATATAAPTATATTATPNNSNQTPQSRNAVAVSPLGTDAPSVFNEKSGFRSPEPASARMFSSTPSPPDERQGSIVGTKEARESTSAPGTTGSGNWNEADNGDGQKKKKRTFVEESRRTFWLVITHSWVNVLLVFVPLGIVLANVEGVSSGVVFAMNSIAVIPLAGLLSFATESVARKMGDALGALLNVTFGNAVELIIFIIALVKNQIRIVQASLLGSILANLLLILGMGFFLGGLRFREQVYNSTVTQMSACLLSLSVISLVLPTAFHASFSDPDLADHESLKISRGTSIILLLVYVIYLLFQLKSHAYLYESTPQNIVDAESLPGPAAAWLDSSSSESSSSDSSDSDDSSHSRDTVRRAMRKVLRHGRRRKSSVASVETSDLHLPTGASSFGTATTNPPEDSSETSLPRPQLPGLSSAETNEEAVEDEERPHHRRRRPSIRHLRKKGKKSRRHNHHHHHHRQRDADGDAQQTIREHPEHGSQARHGDGEPRRVDFAIPKEPAADGGNETGTGSKRPFPALRSMSVKNLAPTVFVQKPELDVLSAVPAGPVPRVRYGIRRTNSLPDRLNHQIRPPGAMLPAQVPLTALNRSLNGSEDDEDEEHLTQVAAIFLLLVTTGLVAACAEFLIGSIEDVVATSSVGEIFIGLILLPIVGNAAEHVTAVTVAMKNKMDLAIGVAIGSSIQIAIFVTPLVVILGWILDKEMTLYFTLFETVCLFVSTFMVNFLVLDGRSNYLEGALLCAVYSIIGVVAFFYPAEADASSWGS
ncbi:sodium calcium exchanger membrane region [Trichoderma cornu-damae]|uniref:Sodium calcium exchanger membrane region n=1 Tax=Trichoderma cornu-damae TaxID=654480 RepID=A0A9P8QQ11_9HYPO|nr:sodium calcium exchanger membrane region [Trichoderma cornu-damae]